MEGLSVSERPQDQDSEAIDLPRRVQLLIEMLKSRKAEQKCRIWLQQLACLLPGPPTPQKLAGIDVSSPQNRQMCQLFGSLFEALLDSSLVQDETALAYVDLGPAEDVLHALMEAVRRLAPCQRRDTAAALLVRLVDSDACLFAILRPSFALTDRWEWEEDWLKPISALADVAANALQLHLPQRLTPVAVCRSMAVQIARGVFVLRCALEQGVDVSVQPLAVLLRQFCAKYPSGHTLDPLLPLIDGLTRDNFVGRRVWNSLVDALDDRCLHQVVGRCASWAGHPDTFKRLTGWGPGRFPLTDRWRRILCSNLLFLQRHEEAIGDRVVENVLTWLSLDAETLWSVSLDLLSVWSDKNSLLLTSADQHELISRAVVVALELLGEQLLRSRGHELQLLLNRGVSNHLESTDVQLRSVAMVLAEVCTKLIRPDGPVLKFEYDESESCVQRLRAARDRVRSKRPEPESGDFESLLQDALVETDGHEPRLPTRKGPEESVQEQTKPSEGQEAMTDEEQVEKEALDSDDDLEPYDMSHDREETKFPEPHYIRDLMDMLANGGESGEADEFERIRTALAVGERLIRQQLGRDHASLTRQLLSILLHLQDKFDMDDFLDLRFRSMTAAVVSQPREAAAYLTQEFYAENYSIIQRLDMLRVINAAAREISSQPTCEQDVKTLPPKGVEADWRQVVRQRIEANTRHFAVARSAAAFRNRFGPLAGEFFFPLAARFDRCLAHLSLMDGDFVLLSSLLCTLASLVHCAGTAPAARSMVRSLVDVVWLLRLHPQASVRESVLVAFCQCLLATNSQLLLSDYALQITDWGHWLLNSMQSDPADRVRLLAEQAASLLARLSSPA